MKILGLFLVLACTIGGLMMAAGVDKAIHLLTANILPAAPGEIVIILGCAISAFVIANTQDTIKHTIKYLGALVNPTAYSKDDYLHMLCTLFTLFKLARTKGWLALETHIETPHESDLFGQFDRFQSNHHGLVFVCDYLRIISLGNDDPHELEALMDAEIEGIAEHEEHPGHAVQTMADAIPALGIVAAVLGVIKTMASISEPPEVLGKLIGGALVGTFLGVWFAYGFFGPIAGAMNAKAQSEILYFKVMKTCLIAFLNGAAPQVAIEFGRKLMPHDIQPSFQELEETLNDMTAAS